MCGTCLGMAKRHCPTCHKTRQMEDIEREILEYLLLTWQKLKKFRMQTTGCDTLDYQVKTEFGDWRYLEEPYLV